MDSTLENYAETVKKTPDFDLLSKSQNGPWKKIGAAWGKAEGKISATLDLVPPARDGRVNFLLVPRRLQLPSHTEELHPRPGVRA